MKFSPDTGRRRRLEEKARPPAASSFRQRSENPPGKEIAVGTQSSRRRQDSPARRQVGDRILFGKYSGSGKTKAPNTVIAKTTYGVVA